MSDQIEKIESGRWSDGRYISLPFTPEQIAINTLIDHIHALEKRVERLEGEVFCNCDEPSGIGECLHCRKRRTP